MRIQKKHKEFIKTVLVHYEKNKRYFPWRDISDPYRVFVSEIMLQQTQTERVVEKYTQFIRKWPVVRALAKASLSEVIRNWNGLGYNRRAKYLHLAAGEIMSRFNGVFPNSPADLITLPGVGPYTAGAVSTFAFNLPNIFIDTNIRSVYIFYFFGGNSIRKNKITDMDIIPLMEKTLDLKNPRRWYYALMDYGFYIKKNFFNPSRYSSKYRVQTKFKNSFRQVRGSVVRYLTKNPNVLLEEMVSVLPHDAVRVGEAAEALVREGIVKEKEGLYYL